MRWLLIFILLSLSACSQLVGSGGLSSSEFSADRELRLEDVYGENHLLSELARRGVVINFLASWCAECRMELQSLDILSKRLGPSGVRIIGIAVDDSTERVRLLIRESQVSFPILMDRSGASKEKFNLSMIPHTFLLNSKGEIVDLSKSKILSHSASGAMISGSELSGSVMGGIDWSPPEVASEILHLLSH